MTALACYCFFCYGFAACLLYIHVFEENGEYDYKDLLMYLASPVVVPYFFWKEFKEKTRL